MRASEIRNQPPRLVTVPVTLRGVQAMTIVIDANKVTRRWAKEADGGGDAYGLYAGLCEVIESWDVTNDDGTPFDVTVENLASLDLTIADDAAIVTQIVEGSVPSDAEGKASAHTSATPNTGYTKSPASLPNGQPTLPSPNVSESPSLT